jgi:hypothetical protein
MVNGNGPYDFVVDTGSTTTIVDSSLFQELGLRQQSAIFVSASPPEQDARVYRWTRASKVSVGGLALSNLELVEATGTNLGPLEHHVRGLIP